MVKWTYGPSGHLAGLPVLPCQAPVIRRAAKKLKITLPKPQP
jgi:hypothetical protein